MTRQRSTERSILQIQMELLHLGCTPQLITHLIYKTNTTGQRLKKRYLQHLLDSNLMTIEGTERELYVTTNKGIETLSRYAKLMECFKT